MKSSFNFVNGDESAVSGNKLSFFKKLFYFLFFIWEWFSEKKINSQASYEINQPELEEFFKGTDISSISPSRISCSVYLIDFLKKNFSKDQTINIIDIGCGSGRYYEYISNLGYQLNYIGLDIAKNTSWKNSTENKKFYEVALGESNTESLKKISSNLKSANLVFSHSALEHIKNDISAVQEINEFCPNALHLHLVPAPSMFLGEILHGWRRYTQNNFKKFNLAFQNRKISFDPIGNHRTRKSFFPHYYQFNQKKMTHDFFNYYQKKYDPLDDLRAISLFKSNERPVFYAMLIKHA